MKTPPSPAQRSLLVVGLLVATGLVAWAAPAHAAYPTAPQITDRYATGAITVRLADAFAAPKSSSGTTAQVARINFLRSEPVESLAAGRLFANDMNGTLSIVDRSTGEFTRYLDFDAIFNGVGVGDFDADPGYAAGLVTMQFDPAYATNGKFYTVHTELGPGSTTAYRQAVVTEWQDSNISDTAFTGARAELLRVQYVSGIHPIGDITFNPAAADATHPDWRNMYVTSGDGGAGESSGATRDGPQRLDTLFGKVLRIHTDASIVTGTYTIPADNPFVTTPATAHPAVFASGFRNPHRLSWDVDDRGVTRGIVADIGLHSYEEVDFLAAGGNYGYSRIEGNQVLGNSNAVTTSPLPETLPIITASGTVGSIAPTYPVALYSHQDGDAISGGFVYRGQAIPALRGKYVFGDIANGRLFYADLESLIAADDGNPATAATIHELNVLYDDPTTPAGVESRRVFDLVRDRWDLRNETATGSTSPNGSLDGDRLPGSAASTGRNDPYGAAYGGGRADIRLAEIDGELSLISKSDGMVRRIVNAMGDADFDGTVGLGDLRAVAAHYDQPGSFGEGDFDLSGRIDIGDLRVLASTYGMVGAGDITPASLAGFSPTLVSDWATALASAPPPPTITVDVAAASRTQAQAARPRLFGRTTLLKTGSGTLVVDRTNTLSGTVVIEGGCVELAAASALGSAILAPRPGGTVSVAAGLAVEVGGLATDSGGLVDLGAGSITVQQGLSSWAAVAAIGTGLGHGLVAGTGVVSSRAELDAARGVPRTVGWLQDGDGRTTLAYAAPGDTNLDWTIDILDAANLIGGGRFDNGSAATWIDGDSTHDGLVDILDAAGFLSTALFDAGGYNPPTSSVSLVATVPEPAGTTLAIGAALIGFAIRQRGRHR